MCRLFGRIGEGMVRMSTIPTPTPEEMRGYRASARQRSARARLQQDRRRVRAWEVARRAACILKAEYAVDRVCLFGSLARAEPFSVQSDIDLMAWGLAEEQFYGVVARLQDLDSTLSIDLIRAEEASPALLSAVSMEGIDL